MSLIILNIIHTAFRINSTHFLVSVSVDGLDKILLSSGRKKEKIFHSFDDHLLTCAYFTIRHWIL